jgi:hypothetical protein
MGAMFKVLGKALNPWRAAFPLVSFLYLIKGVVILRDLLKPQMECYPFKHRVHTMGMASKGDPCISEYNNLPPHSPPKGALQA